ncbi:hypothetical protein Tco_1132324 [Tanacetum coccineum]|uniref:Uncharacterized protein n=1 Tax=Tanacetum coccineum TaxID=301880 RepID=A0ABQ5JEI2_9ASTR
MTSSSQEDISQYLNERPIPELTNILSGRVQTESLTTSVNPILQLVQAHTKQLQQYQQRLDDLSKINVVDTVEESVEAHVVNELKNQLPHVNALMNFIAIDVIEAMNDPIQEDALKKRPTMIRIILKNARGRRNERSKTDQPYEPYEQDVTTEEFGGKYSDWFTKKKSLDWFKDDNAVVHNWFDDNVDANKNPKDDEIIPKGSSLIFANKLKERLKIEKIIKYDLKKTGFELLKSHFTNSLEL